MNKNKNLTLIISILIVVLAQSAVFAAPKEYLDQSQTEDMGEYHLINPAQILAQTFQPGTNGKATSIAIKLSKISATSTDGTPVYPGDLIVEIRTTMNEMNPYDEVIASAKINEIQIEEDVPQWYEVNFTAPPYLKKKNLYALVFKTAQNDDSAGDESLGSYALYYAGQNEYDPYTKGHLLIKRALASHWGCFWPHIDSAFEVYMTKGNN